MVIKNSKFLFLKNFSGHLAILLLMPELPFFPLYLKELSHTEYFVKQDGEVLIKTQNNMRIPLDMVISRVYFYPSNERLIVSKLFLDHGSVLAPDGESPNNGSVTAWQKNASSDVFDLQATVFS